MNTKYIIMILVLLLVVVGCEKSDGEIDMSSPNLNRSGIGDGVGDGNGINRNGGGMNDPNLLFEACKGLVEGDDCNFESSRGEISGMCEYKDMNGVDSLLCVRDFVER